MEKKRLGEIPVLIHSNNNWTNPKPLIILSHWFSGSKEGWIDRMYQLAELNYLVVALDNRFHGEREEGNFHDKVMRPDGTLNMYQLRIIKKDTVKDIRSLIDYCIGNYKIDINKIGMIGISMGGYITYACLIEEIRISLAIPFISSPFWDDLPKDTPISDYQFDKFIKLTKEYNPAKDYKKMYPRSIYMAIGKKDMHFDYKKFIGFYSKLEKQYLNQAGKLKLKIYDVGHEVTDVMWEEAICWLKEQF